MKDRSPEEIRVKEVAKRLVERALEGEIFVQLEGNQELLGQRADGVARRDRIRECQGARIHNGLSP